MGINAVITSFYDGIRSHYAIEFVLGEQFGSLQVTISGSSLLHLTEGDADHSRRCINHDIQGLSMLGQPLPLRLGTFGKHLWLIN